MKDLYGTFGVAGLCYSLVMLFQNNYILGMAAFFLGLYALYAYNQESKKGYEGKSEISSDPWKIQKAQLEKFWLTVFSYTINWNDFKLPEYSDRYPHLNIVPAEFTAEQIYDGIAECTTFKFKKRKKYIDDIDKALRKARLVQSRPTGNYAFADGGTAEPDTEHLNKSYNDSIKAGLIFMGPVEYLLSCAHFEFVTGEVYDFKGATRLSVLCSVRRAMCSFWDSDHSSYLDWCYLGYQPGWGPRVVVFST